MPEENNRASYGFDECKTLDDARTRHKKLVMILHPDRGGDARLFQEMTTAYTARLREINGPARPRLKGAPAPNPLVEALKAQAAEYVASDAFKETVSKGAAAVLNQILKNI